MNESTVQRVEQALPWTPEQLTWLREKAGSFEIVADLSWNIQGLAVTHIDSAAFGNAVVKNTLPEWRSAQNTAPSASPAPVHPHMLREIRAYEQWIEPGAEFAPALRASSRPLGMLVVDFLPGEIVLDSPRAEDPEIWFAAGRATRAFNGEPRARNTSFDGGNISLLARRIEAQGRGEGYQARSDGEADRIAAVCAAAEALLRDYEPQLLPLHTTHADNSPRNWMLSPEGGVRLIDFGRAGIRPRFAEFEMTFGQDPELCGAFGDGLGLSCRPEEWDDAHRRAFMLHSAALFLGGLEWAQNHGESAFQTEILDRDRWLLPLLRHST